MTLTASPPQIDPGVITRKYAPGMAACVNCLIQPLAEASPGIRTRNPRARHLKYYLGADPPPLPHAGTADIYASCRQVLAESAVRQRPQQDSFPEIKIRPCVRVHRLIGSAMMLHVKYPVASQADSAVALRSRHARSHRAVDSPFLDAGRSQALPRIGLWPADVNREHPHITDSTVQNFAAASHLPRRREAEIITVRSRRGSRSRDRPRGQAGRATGCASSPDPP